MRARRRADADRGSAAVEVALVAPVFMALLMIVVYAGRLTQAQNEVQSAAAAAARAASQSAEAVASDRAQVAALDNLDSSEVTCSEVDVAPDGDFRPGGTVQVTVSCTVAMDDLMFLAFPGSRTLTATATEVIDTYRGGS